VIEWSETHLAFQEMVRRFVQSEVKPKIYAGTDEIQISQIARSLLQ
jgi:hypothetical protein